MRKPMIGEKMRGRTTFCTNPDHTTFSIPNADIPAPTTPPIRAWLDDEGMPKYQVTRFQIIAPISADMTSTCEELRLSNLTLPGSTRPLVIVLATACPVSAP